MKIDTSFGEPRIKGRSSSYLRKKAKEFCNKNGHDLTKFSPSIIRSRSLCVCLNCSKGIYESYINKSYDSSKSYYCITGNILTERCEKELIEHWPD